MATGESSREWRPATRGDLEILAYNVGAAGLRRRLEALGPDLVWNVRTTGDYPTLEALFAQTRHLSQYKARAVLRLASGMEIRAEGAISIEWLNDARAVEHLARVVAHELANCLINQGGKDGEQVS